MNCLRIYHKIAGKVVLPALLGLLIRLGGAEAAAEESFDVLQIGTHSYSNVTVTTKAKTYIFIMHSAGMETIKLADLPEEVQEKLGYIASKPKPKPALTSSATVWAKERLAKLDVPQAQVQWNEWMMKLTGGRSLEDLKKEGQSLLANRRGFVLSVLAGGLGFYLLFCNFCRLICQKTGKEAGGLVWLPVLKIIPLLRAAGMSGWWFLLCLVPVLNLVPGIIWAFKIAKARGKDVAVGILLLIPGLNVFAFLYLALADGGGSRSRKHVLRGAPVMTLETE